MTNKEYPNNEIEQQARIELKSRIHIAIKNSVDRQQTASIHFDDGEFLTNEKRAQLQKQSTDIEAYQNNQLGQFADLVELRLLMAKFDVLRLTHQYTKATELLQKISVLQVRNGFNNKTVGEQLQYRLRQSTISFFISDHDRDMSHRSFSIGGDDVGFTNFTRMQIANGGGSAGSFGSDGSFRMTPIDKSAQGNGLFVICPIAVHIEQVHDVDSASEYLFNSVDDLLNQSNVTIHYAFRSLAGIMQSNLSDLHAFDTSRNALSVQQIEAVVKLTEQYI